MTHEQLPAIPILDSIALLSRRYNAWLVDIWGVLHNGVRPFTPAVEACQLYRQSGGVVILVSNSPRPREGVVQQLRQIGVPDDAYDGVATSGDVTRTLVSAYAGRGVYHLGPERDLGIFTNLPVTFAEPDDATAIVCSGLVDDDTETPEDYADLLAALHARELPMICANPDIVVERGDKLIYCAGALAEAYEGLGGRVIYAGKPHKPIYELALALVTARRSAALPRHRVVAIGDGIRTDMLGAAGQNIDAVFVASAVHMANMRNSDLTLEAVAKAFAGQKKLPVAAFRQLAW
jgi:HAD superfamily hydrolase (TIGR01459 family)